MSKEPPFKQLSFEKAFDYALLKLFGIKTFAMEMRIAEEKIRKSSNPKVHWYSVKMTYRSKDMSVLFDFVTYVGYLNQEDVFDFKLAKQHFFKNIKNDPRAKKLLCNGVVSVEIIGYLGFFAKKEK
jgi:hypothetical protein